MESSSGQRSYYGQYAYDPGYLTDPEEEPAFVDPYEFTGERPGERYSEFLQTDCWQQAREAVLKRDGGRCVHCNSDWNVQVHHRRYCQRGTELENLHLLEAVCRRCHEKEHA